MKVNRSGLTYKIKETGFFAVDADFNASSQKKKRFLTTRA